MQTFLTSTDYIHSLFSLDKKRLNKQRVEVHQIIQTLETGSGWRNHPAVRMWEHNLGSLKVYANICNKACSVKGINHTAKTYNLDEYCITHKPLWMDKSIILTSHRANLLRKDFKFYSAKGWLESPHMPYFWPVKITCKKTGVFDDNTKMWVKLNSPEQKSWYNIYQETGDLQCRSGSKLS